MGSRMIVGRIETSARKTVKPGRASGSSAWPSSQGAGSVRSSVVACFAYFACLMTLLLLVCLWHFVSRFCLWEDVIFSSTRLMIMYFHCEIVSLLVELEKVSESSRMKRNSLEY